MQKPLPKKHWREFNILVQDMQPEPSEEESMSARLGIPGLDPKKEEPVYHTTTVRFPLEDVSDYYASFNSIISVKGVCVHLYTGAHYFIHIPFKDFVTMRQNVGLEIDPDYTINSPEYLT